MGGLFFYISAVLTLVSIAWDIINAFTIQDIDELILVGGPLVSVS
jgi:hypothetical protein